MAKEPHSGMRISDCYMGGIGELSDIGSSGRVEIVMSDYMVVRTSESKPIFVMEDQYDCIKELRENEDED